jgi:hypothetical protein
LPNVYVRQKRALAATLRFIPPAGADRRNPGNYDSGSDSDDPEVRRRRRAERHREKRRVRKQAARLDDGAAVIPPHSALTRTWHRICTPANNSRG